MQFTQTDIQHAREAKAVRLWAGFTIPKNRIVEGILISTGSLLLLGPRWKASIGLEMCLGG